MSKYRLSKKAIIDLKNIWDYTYDKWSEYQSDIYYHMLIESFDKVSKNPKSGKKYSMIIDDLKGYKAGRHIIFYRLTNASYIEITRILHEQMDLKNHMK